MAEGATLGIVVSFSAGILSFLSPCVLPLIPSYVTFVTGMSLEDLHARRRSAFTYALLFVLGFSMIFLAFGATATVVGRLLLSERRWLAAIGGALLILFGAYLLGAFHLGILDRDRRVQISEKPLGYLGTVLVGIAFGAGWSPCIGPILGGILTYTATEENLSRGLLMLAAYSLGLALPFLLAAVAIQQFIGFFQRFRAHIQWVDRAAGVLLIVVGVLLVTNYLGVLAAFLQGLTPSALRQHL